MKKLILLCSLLLIYVSCKPQEYTLDRQDLFTINLGIFEDEMDFFEREHTRFTYASGFTLTQGFFYIYNAGLGKIMKFSNNGDILSLLYTPRLNIPFTKIIPEGINQHNFNNIEKITVDNNGLIYAVDRIIVDESKTQLTPYKRIVKVFDERGNFRYFLGHTGISGEPFAYIDHLSINNRNEITIISRDETNWYIHQFDAQGNPIYASPKINYQLFSPIEDSYITEITIASTGSFALINTSQFIEMENHIQIYVYDMETNLIIDNFKIDALDNMYPYSTLGVDQWERFYFYAFNFTTGSYNILLYEPNKDMKSFHLGGEFKLLLPKEEFPALFNQLYLSKDGLIASMSIYDRWAQFSWWRSDQIYKKDISENEYV